MGRVPEFDPTKRLSPYMRALAWSARQRPVTWFLVNVGNKIDPHLMRATGGRVKSTLSGPTVLLTHTGAKSGRARVTPLAYHTDGEQVILIGSKGGARNHPAWYHNILANPEVELWAKGQGGHYRAHEAEGEERAEQWSKATTWYPGFAKYQERAGDRRIPVVVCTPADD